MSEFALEVFISHSSDDADLAMALIEVLRGALMIPANKIRCTSVDGYRLPGGADSDDSIRQEVRSALSFIGLITPASWASAYVLFELGARWGAHLPLVPLLAGISPRKLAGPLVGLNALDCTVEAQADQLIEDIGKTLQRGHQPVSSYRSKMANLVSLARSRKAPSDKSAISPLGGVEGPFPPFGYVFKNGDRENPLCPKCWQENPPREAYLTALQEWNKGLRRTCRICGHHIYEKEMDLSPRSAFSSSPFRPPR